MMTSLSLSVATSSGASRASFPPAEATVTTDGVPPPLGVPTTAKRGNGRSARPSDPSERLLTSERRAAEAQRRCAQLRGDRAAQRVDLARRPATTLYSLSKGVRPSLIRTARQIGRSIARHAVDLASAASRGRRAAFARRGATRTRTSCSPRADRETDERGGGDPDATRHDTTTRERERCARAAGGGGDTTTTTTTAATARPTPRRERERRRTSERNSREQSEGRSSFARSAVRSVGGGSSQTCARAWRGRVLLACSTQCLRASV